MERMLVIEDDRSLYQPLQHVFEADGFRLDFAADGAAGIEAFRNRAPALVVLDLKLPKIHGREVCRTIRSEAPAVPVIVLSAVTDEVDKVLMLELGADDYVTKPFSPMELRARIKALLRRRAPETPQVFRFGEFEVDFSRFELRRAGKPVDLTPIEFKLLAAFVQNRRGVLSRQQLLDHVWGHDIFVTDRVVDTHVGNLRRKVEADPENPVFLVSVRGVGYRFEA